MKFDALTTSAAQAYSGKRLPDAQTALIRCGAMVRIDGKEIPESLWWYLDQPRDSIRVLPGTHHLEVALGGPLIRLYTDSRSIDFDVEAGEVYWVRTGKELDYIWVLDETGSVVAGAKPPEE